MREFFKWMFGAVPAVFMTLGAFMFVRVMSSPLQYGLLAAAILGTAGLVWSLIGYSSKFALLILVLLSIGVCAMSVALLPALRNIFDTAQLSRADGTIAITLVMLGQVTIGFIQGWQALRILWRAKSAAT